MPSHPDSISILSAMIKHTHMQKPGSFFLEMALEAAGGLPVTLTNVEYKA